MTKNLLGEFEDQGWEGYACTFLDWATCVNSTAEQQADECGKCTSKRSGKNESIVRTLNSTDGQIQFKFPPGGIFPVTEQFTIPPNTAIIGAANPNDPADKTKQQTDIAGQTWFVVTKSSALCGDDPMCKDASAKASFCVMLMR